MLAGVPIIPGFIILVVFMAIAMFLMPVYELKAFGSFPAGPALYLFPEDAHERDDQALRILGLENLLVVRPEEVKSFR